MTSLPNPDDELEAAIEGLRNILWGVGSGELPYSAGSMKLAQKVEALIKSEKQALLDTIQAGVPEKDTEEYLEFASQQYAEGGNDMIDQFNATIEDVRREINGG
jgi:hypothetical protein